MKRYSVIYRTGGTENAKWHRVLESFKYFFEADTCAESIRKMGYKALVHKTKDLEAIGMPEGWEA